MTQRCLCADTNRGATFDPAPIRGILSAHAAERSALVPILQAVQQAYGFLPREALCHVSKALRMPLADVYSVATFYPRFHLKPQGEHIVRICQGSTCHVKGAPEVTAAIVDVLGAKVGDTTADGRFTIEVTSCVGCCGLAPVVLVDGETFGGLTPKSARSMFSRIRRGRRS